MSTIIPALAGRAGCIWLVISMLLLEWQNIKESLTGPNLTLCPRSAVRISQIANGFNGSIGKLGDNCARWSDISKTWWRILQVGQYR